ncbi:MAG: ABC transporter substrate-binding protein, partial [Candidatus Accumulibacter sp.]|jgi:hypothetical protein|nr:ABC transporter substrate-binding protein [Accumulibacter sp.]
MSLHNNPFIRGYWGLHVQRLLSIACKEKRTARLALHPSQAHLPDCEVTQRSCLICNGYAISGTMENLSGELTAYCNRFGYEQGFVTNAHYTILADENGRSVRLGDAFSREQANEIVRRLTFQPGFFNRCWEISAKHLEKAGMDYLKKRADEAEPLDFFSAFHVGCDQIGVKLFNVDWSNANMRYAADTNAVEVFLAHLENGMPISLAKTLYLAGEADTRFLIFAHGAPELDGLPAYDY